MPFLNRLSLVRCLGALATLLVAVPSEAGLQVQVSRTQTGRYQSVGITVTDPMKGLDAPVGPLSVTMADGRDRRQTLFLEPTGQPGKWSGRFTPVATGRYTGTAILERKDSTEIGLVPLVRVGSSRRPGFVRLHPTSPRVLRFSNGRTLFPIGVSLDAAAVRAQQDWGPEFRRLVRSGVNYLHVGVDAPEGLTDDDRRATERAVDQLLLLAEGSTTTAVQLAFQLPEGAGEEQADSLARWVRRWSFSPAVSAWEIGSAAESSPGNSLQSLVQAIKRADAYHHLVAIPASLGDPKTFGADLGVGEANWQRPENRRVVQIAGASQDGSAPLPGENSWQLLAVGGVGLPLQPYLPGSGEGAVLQRLATLSRFARTMPLHAAPYRLRGVVPEDQPGSFYRYGTKLAGWYVPEGDRPLVLTGLRRGRHHVRIVDASRDQVVQDVAVWSDGHRAEVKAPAGLRAAYIQVEPGAGGKPAPVRRVVAVKPRPYRPAPIRAPRPVKPVRRVVVKPARLTPAQLRARKAAQKRQALAAAKKAKAAKLQAAKAKKSKRGGRAIVAKKPAKTKRATAKKSGSAKAKSGKKPAKKLAKKPVKKKTASKKPTAKKPAKKVPVKKRVVSKKRR